MIDKGYFIGKEVEGHLKGRNTLFISTEYNARKIGQILEDKEISQIYFGAGFQSSVDYPFVYKNANEYHKNGYIITVEIDISKINNIPQYIISSSIINKVLTIKNLLVTDKYIDNIFLKIEGPDGIYMYNKYIFNNWEEYIDDKEV